LLRHSLASLRRQTYPQLEVLLLDYSSGAGKDELHQLTQDFESNGWRLVPAAGSLCGAAPTHTAAEAHGEYVLLMEGSDYLTPEAVAVFVKVASRTGPDVLTCFLAQFTGALEPAEAKCLGHYPFLGNAILPGVFRNHFGLRVIFIRKDTLLRVGTFNGNVHRERADWEFLARAALMHCHIEVVPAPLAWHRISDESDPHVSMEYLDQERAITPYAEAMTAALRELPKAALTMGLLYQAMYNRFGDGPARAILQRRSASRTGGKQDSVLDHEGALLLAMNQMPKRARRKIASIVDGWLEYSVARSQLPSGGFRRIAHIARHLVRGHYHRYAHGFGSALRDLRKPSRPVAKDTSSADTLGCLEREDKNCQRV
jgi:hypothetical protein